ncbi:MAG: phosphotransferase [Terracidiphilus sp.]|jgi:Ser/Thr protein kinase RdoA (MazF antagonist)
MNGKPKTHGMDGTLVAPDWAPLSPAELRALFTRFPALAGPIEIMTESPRPLSAAGLVKTAAGQVFVKRHARAVRDRQGLAEEHRFMAHLRDRGAGVPSVLADAEGETAIEIGDWTYEVHSAAEGIDLYGEALSWTPFQCSQHAFAAGEAMARMHLAAEGFEAPRRRVQPLVASFTIFAAEKPRVAMEEYLAARSSLAGHAKVRACADEALQLLAPFHARLRPLLPALAPLWTHNDLHASNLLWSESGSGSRVTAIIDFGLSDRTNAVHDLAHAIERNIVEWLVLVANPDEPDAVPVHLDHVEALLAGYESVRLLTVAERAALAPMTALCHAEFALSEADYFIGVLNSDDKAAMAYEGWLVGHARWFHSRAAQRLVEWITEWSHAHRGAAR